MFLLFVFVIAVIRNTARQPLKYQGEFCKLLYLYFLSPAFISHHHPLPLLSSLSFIQPLTVLVYSGLNSLQSGLHKQHMKDLFVELCLTVPVRLSSLLPYLPMLMDPLVSALNGSPTLISQVSLVCIQLWCNSKERVLYCCTIVAFESFHIWVTCRMLFPLHFGRPSWVCCPP
jgi:hypothetical protein